MNGWLHNRRRGGRGLTLIEVLVAVVLLAVGISACSACIGSAVRASGRAEEFTAVQLMAREKLTEIELRGGSEGVDQGDFGPERPGYGWRTTTTRTDVQGLHRVQLTLIWGDPQRPRTAECTTYIRRGR
jgi:prepilin-type N-terminal cleavage/methylation domain-containing protein